MMPPMDLFLPGMETATPRGLELLARDPSRAVYLDLETDGLGAQSVVTVVACLQGGSLQMFTRDESFNGVLSLLDAASVVVTFNGATFDSPRILDHFRIPKLLCPHLDLRQVCREAGWKGGLKEIERKMGIARPRDVVGVDGEQAIWLWRCWERDRDAASCNSLLRYCAADVVALESVAKRLIRQAGLSAEGDVEPVWALLDAITDHAAVVDVPVREPALPGSDDAMTERLRKFRRDRAPSQRDSM